MFDTLGNRLDDIFRKLRSRGRLTEKEIDEALREIRVALLEADVALPAVRTFLQHVKAEALGEDVLKSLTPGQQVIKIVHEELVRMLGGQSAGLVTASKPPTVIMLAGLQGSGKTSTAGKLAALLRRKGQRPLLVAADLQRPAAIRQLQILGEQAKVAVHAEMGETDPVAVVRRALEEGRRDADVVIIDTAGRLHVDPEMMDQVARVHALAQPHEVLFVLDAMTGQDALVSAKAFAETIPLTGIIVTKLDGDARGGAALSAATVTGRPIKFAGMGEKLADLEPFHPDRIASRILGMGDVLTLIEKAEAAFDADQAHAAEEKLRSGRFTLEDFLDQMRQMKKMGPLQSIVGMLPGVPKELRDAELDEGELGRVEAIICSMTPAERREPSLINGSRRHRIAQGSGTSTQQVNALLKQFKVVQQMMRTMNKGSKKGRRRASVPGLPGLPGR
jgi:signal recognition particle subunit SRP54